MFGAFIPFLQNGERVIEVTPDTAMDELLAQLHGGGASGQDETKKNTIQLDFALGAQDEKVACKDPLACLRLFRGTSVRLLAGPEKGNICLALDGYLADPIAYRGKKHLP